MPAVDRGERTLPAEPLGEARGVERRGVGMCPRIVGVDGRGQLNERPLHTLLVAALDLAHPRDVVADVDTVDEPPADLARIGNVARLDRQPELLDKIGVGGVPWPKHLATGLDRAPVGERHRLDAASGPVPSLEHDHVSTRTLEVPRGTQSRQSCPQHGHVDHSMTPVDWICRRRLRSLSAAPYSDLSEASTGGALLDSDDPIIVVF